MQTENLFELTQVLLEKKSVKAAELAKQFKVSNRTIYRWIDALNEAGIPLYTSKGNGGGIFISKEYATDKKQFSEEDKQEILKNLHSLNELSNGAIFSKKDSKESVISKFKFLFSGNNTKIEHSPSPVKQAPAPIQIVQGNSNDSIVVDFEPWNSKGQEIQQSFELLKAAISQKTNIEFDFLSMSGQSSSKKVSPWKIVFKSGTWYLYGWSFDKNTERFFKLNRMMNIKLTSLDGKESEDFVNFDNKTINFISHMNPPQMVKVVLHVSEFLLPMLMDEYNAESVEELDEETFKVTLFLPDSSVIDGYLLSFGEGLEVIEPSHIRERIKDEIVQMSEHYK